MRAANISATSASNSSATSDSSSSRRSVATSSWVDDGSASSSSGDSDEDVVPGQEGFQAAPEVEAEANGGTAEEMVTVTRKHGQASTGTRTRAEVLAGLC